MVSSPANPAGIGVLGCGNIFSRYIDGMAKFPDLNVVGCADMLPDRAAAAAAEAGIEAYESVHELLDDPRIDIVVNITPPVAHATLLLDTLDAGKHTFVEKPLAASVAEGRKVLDAAVGTSLLVGAAADTFLGSAGQTARCALDDGVIGAPIGAAAFVTHSKAETWHPNPTFLFKPGGGPVLDLGPYYLSALVNCLGPITSVAGRSRVGASTRRVTAPDRDVEEIQVEVDTHASAVLEFATGVLGTVMMSFDVWDHHLPFLEIYGEEGTLGLADPNTYDGDVVVRRHDDQEWRVLQPVMERFGAPGWPDQFLRGPGIADLASAIGGGPHRATAELAFHVLEVLEAIDVSSRERRFVQITSRCDRPAPIEGSE